MDEHMEKMFNHVNEAIKIIHKRADVINECSNNPPKSIRGHIECPSCGAQLSYVIVGYNGHVHGKCATNGCLNWSQ
jgi:hypothetical protein